MQRRLRQQAMAEGATLVDPSTVFFSADTQLGRDVVVGPFVVFGPGVTHRRRRRDPRLLPYRAAPPSATARSSAPSRGSGPAPSSATDVHIGNFVEIKNSRFGRGRQGQPSLLSRRRDGRQRRQYRRRHHHLQLRRLREASHGDRRRAPSSAPTPRWWRRSRSAPAPMSAPAASITQDVPRRRAGRRARAARGRSPVGRPRYRARKTAEKAQKRQGKR